METVGVWECDVLTHKCLALSVYKRGELGVGMLTAAVDHVNSGVGAVTLVCTTLSNEVLTLDGEESLRHIGGHLVCLDVTADLV